jgi:hypothetical protein
MSSAHRVNVIERGRYADLLCADCTWVIRGAPVKAAGFLRQRHELDPSTPVAEVRWADAPEVRSDSPA